MALLFPSLSHVLSQHFGGRGDLVFQERCPRERVGPLPSLPAKRPSISPYKAAGGREQIKTQVTFKHRHKAQSNHSTSHPASLLIPWDLSFESWEFSRSSYDWGLLHTSCTGITFLWTGLEVLIRPEHWGGPEESGLWGSWTPTIYRELGGGCASRGS